MELETERLILRPWTEADAKSVIGSEKNFGDWGLFLRR